MGMCFGVRDALKVIDDLAEPASAAVHGELVHNEVVLDRLQERGIEQTPEGDRGGVPSRPNVVITAHGVSDRERSRLAASGKNLVDTTCPLVRKAHNAAQRLHDEGRLVVVIGKPGHVEVRGLVGDLERFVVVARPESVDDYRAGRLGVVCQTTTPDDVLQSMLEAIRRRNPSSDVRFVDTVCEPTRARQRSVAALIARCDRVVVVGGRNSNNTAELARRCRAAGVDSVHIQGPDGLSAAWVRDGRVIGLTAGTSTLSETVDAVESRLRELMAAC